MIQLSTELQIALSVALTDAANRRHEFAGFEHLLAALTLDDVTIKVLGHAGTDVPKLRARLLAFLDQDAPTIPDGADVEPQLSRGVQRALARAAAHVEGSGREVITGPTNSSGRLCRLGGP